MSDFYTASAVPSTGSALASSVVRAEFALIAAAMAKLAPYTGHGGEIIAVNTGGTAYESIATTGTGNVVKDNTPTLITPVLGAATGTSLVLSGAITGTGGTLTNIIMVNPALGTPASGVLTNCTGTAAGLTVGVATTATNATNLTGSGTVSDTATGGAALTPTNLGVAAPSRIRTEVANGYGSSNTKFRRFTNVTVNQGGSDITYADSATLGASFTINTSGTYGVVYVDDFNATSALGITVNDTQGTVNMDNAAITTANILCMNFGTLGEPYPCSAIHYFTAGDVVRAHTNGAAVGGINKAIFEITRLNGH